MCISIQHLRCMEEGAAVSNAPCDTELQLLGMKLLQKRQRVTAPEDRTRCCQPLSKVRHRKKACMNIPKADHLKRRG